MNILLFIIVFLFGSIIGSFLNVVIYRLNTGKSIVKGHSICMSCGKSLRWFELIPIFSFLLQSGRCRRCKTKISLQYIIVEVITAIVFSMIIFKFLPLSYFSFNYYIINTIIYLTLFSLLIVISVYDIRHKIIPPVLSLVFIIISFVSIFINVNPFGGLFVLPSISLIISGPLLALPFVLLWLLSNGRLMGLGDGKVTLGLGWMLGMSQGFFGLILSFFIGSVVSILILFIFRKKVNMKTEIPFAPFLAIGAFISFIFNLNFLHLVKIFSF